MTNPYLQPTQGYNEPSDGQEYNAESDVKELIEGNEIDHPTCGEMDMLHVIGGMNEYLEGKDRARFNELLSDAIKKYDSFELNYEIEKDLEACL